MDAGLLDRRVAIKRATSTMNGFNEPELTWTTLATVWASVIPVSDGERVRAGETLAMRQSRFTIRWSSTAASVNPKDRLLFDGLNYDVNGVKEVGRREYIEITATARTDG